MQNPETALLPKPVRILGANVVSGRGRGKTIGIPTINVELGSVPSELLRGIYACFITIDKDVHKGALHYGPRPSFRDTETMEIHVIDEEIANSPPTVDLEIVAYIRSVENFETIEGLVAAIRQDIDACRAILPIA